MNSTFEIDFIQAIKNAGLPPPLNILNDARFHRFSTNDKINDDAGWYILKETPTGIMLGAFGCFRSGIKENWSNVPEDEFDPAKKREFKSEVNKYVKDSEKKRQQDDETAAGKAEKVWTQAKPADPEHPYLVKKNVKAFDLRQSRYDGLDVLIVPMRDAQKKIWSYQRIKPDGNKRFFKGGRTSGNFHVLGEPTPTKIICEGFATAASIHQSTGHTVYIAFYAGNLKNVAKTIRKTHPEADLIIAADDDWKTSDNPGLNKGLEAARSVKARFAIPTWPKDKRGEKDCDFNDLAQSLGPEHVKRCIERAEKPEADEKTKEDKSTNEEKKSQATALVAMAEARCGLFTDGNNEPHVNIPVNGHDEIYRIESGFFRTWMSQSYWREHDGVANETSVKSAINTLKGLAQFGGDQRKVFLRAGEHDGNIYIDLADDQWRSIEITKTGWKVIDKPPITFCRTSSMRPLPEPKKPGDINLLWDHINISEENRLLLIAWMLNCFDRNTPDIVLELVGEHGSGKSVTHNYLVELIDPNTINLSLSPDKISDLQVSALHRLVVSFENASNLSALLQDRICGLSTGAGFSVRTLYMTVDETAKRLQNPVILNSIVGVISRADLLDRAIFFELPRLDQRKKVSSMNKRFEQDQPYILAGLLDLLCEVQKILPEVVIPPDKLPRMGDFAALGEAVYLASGQEKGQFLRDYAANRRRGVHRSLDASSVSTALISFMESHHAEYFEGTVKELLQAIEPHKLDGETFVRSPKGLADALRRIGPSLRMVGLKVKIESRPRRDGYHVFVEKTLDEDETPGTEKKHPENESVEAELEEELY